MVSEPIAEFRTTTRPGGLAIVLAIAMLGHATAALLYAYLVEAESARTAVYFGSKIIVNAIPIVWVFGIERRRVQWPRPNWSAVRWGLGSGAFIGAVIVALYYIAFAGRLDANGLLDRGGAYGALEHFFLFAVFLCLGNSAMEEYYWRWFVFGELRRLTRLPWAVLYSALGFTLHHIVVLSAYFPDVPLVVLLNVGVFTGGCIWALVYHRCGSIFGPWISHLMVDVAIMIAAHDLLFGG